MTTLTNQSADANVIEAIRTHRRHVAMGWLRYLIHRLMAAVIATVGLLVAVFFIVRLVPGDPARRIAGPDATPELVAEIRSQLGLDDSIWNQFTEFIRGAIRFDFGDSLVTGQPAVDVIAERLPFTLELAAAGLAVGCVLGTVLGVVAAAMTRGGAHPRFERYFVRITGGLGALPEIAAATALVAVVSVWLNALPVSGVQGISSMILPALAIGLRPAFNLARVIRVEMLDVLKQPYIRTATSKRVSRTRLYLIHALPNAMTAILTLFGLLFAHVVGGVVVVETLFAWPGIGSATIQAVLDRDYPLIQALVTLIGVVVIVTNLVVDQLIGLFDKRVVLGITRGEG